MHVNWTQRYATTQRNAFELKRRNLQARAQQYSCIQPWYYVHRSIVAWFFNDGTNILIATTFNLLNLNSLALWGFFLITPSFSLYQPYIKILMLEGINNISTSLISFFFWYAVSFVLLHILTQTTIFCSLSELLENLREQKVALRTIMRSILATHCIIHIKYYMNKYY